MRLHLPALLEHRPDLQVEAIYCGDSMTMTDEERKIKTAEYRKLYYAKNREKILARCAEYRAAHRDEINAKKIEYSRKYYSENREKCIESSRRWQREHHDEDAPRKSSYMKQWKESNADHVKEYMAKYRADNDELLKDWRKKYNSLNSDEISKKAKVYREKHYCELSEKHKKYREEHLEVRRAQAREYHHSHPEKNREYASCRRSRMFLAPGRGISAEQEQQIFEQYAYHCAYCGRGDVKLEIDHIEPLSNGGAHDIENATASCRPCNTSKKNKSLLRFLYDRRRAEIRKEKAHVHGR